MKEARDGLTTPTDTITYQAWRMTMTQPHACTAAVKKLLAVSFCGFKQLSDPAICSCDSHRLNANKNMVQQAAPLLNQNISLAAFEET